jgi:hypothetical protein
MSKRIEGSIPRHAVMITMGLSLILAGSVWATEYAFVVSTDYWSTAYYSAVEIPPPRTPHIALGTVSTDPVVHYDANEDMVFVVNRYLADNVQVVDTDPLFSTIMQYSVGNGSNPHDIRLASNQKAYISRYEWKTLLIVHPYTGDSLGIIDLSPLADADGIPEMDRMEIVDGKLFVTLNNIDRSTWLPDGPGKIAVIDTEADTLIDCDPDAAGLQPITMTLPNPYGELRYDPCRQHLIVACLGAWGDLAGGVEIIDPSALETKGVVIGETALGGDVSDALLAPTGKGYAVVMDPIPWPDNFARLVVFDPVTGEVCDTLYQQTTGMGSSVGTIELNRQGEVYLCDRDALQPGLRIYDTASDEMIAQVDVGVPPFDLEFLHLTSAAAEGLVMQPPSSLTLDIGPNPFRASVEITFTIPAGPSAPVDLKLYDVTGRMVRRLMVETGHTGMYKVRWDGRDGCGTRVADGLYFCRLHWNGRIETKAIAFAR